MATSDEKETKENTPTVCIVIGMAGSGKTALMQRMNAFVREYKRPSYVMNLDPAVYEVPYEANIDIRDTVHYKNVMKQYGLGPNGGILTALNLFATKFDQAIELIDARRSELEFVFVDTPGQIEVFTWSASGQIITETLAASHPTVLLYVMDTARCFDPITFMSNMTYACSIHYKTKLPFLIVFNKIDVQSHAFAVRWMHNLDDFHEAMKRHQTYQSTLVNALGTVLDAFYQNIQTVGVSAVTGQGTHALFEQIEKCRQQYWTQYKPMIEKKIKQNKEKNEMKLKNEENKTNANNDDHDHDDNDDTTTTDTDTIHAITTQIKKI
eukprot:CAMPEP_0202700758 /NCGR_PEP_ID=MMETSP1385-20130828/13929_1 /ASSEMBLY_ACC=CAM_ASM_000861 /TAXON_ID=933848 /ORGANISM="Elphidium margaritaceum" /LENGTH=323 /DNA_ID=CAMNT_0049358019 /DNA_START=31 /DNA_END=1002 /DNA_ORIENTATION=-